MIQTKHNPTLTTINALLLCLILTGCLSPSDISGPNGYTVSCDKGKDCIVDKNQTSGGVMIAPEVELYAFVNQYIVGRSIPAKTYSGKPDPNQVKHAGYFIVDTLKHETTEALSESQWKQQLTRLGLPIPKLLPSPFENKPPLRDK